MAKVKGMCKLHYNRVKAGQDLSAPRRSYTVGGTDCIVDGCTEKAKAQGLCSVHYQRKRNKGSVDAPVRPSGEERFFALYRTDGPIAKNNPELGRCWVPKRDVKGNHGYAVFTVGRRHMPAYRWSYEHWIGPIPEGLEMDHFACDNGPGGCANPYHVRPGTHTENMARARRHNAEKDRCPKGHLYDEDNTFINVKGSRECKICRRDKSREGMRLRRARLKAEQLAMEVN